jgi:hypothetical protein
MGKRTLVTPVHLPCGAWHWIKEAERTRCRKRGHQGEERSRLESLPAISRPAQMSLRDSAGLFPAGTSSDRRASEAPHPMDISRWEMLIVNGQVNRVGPGRPSPPGAPWCATVLSHGDLAASGSRDTHPGVGGGVHAKSNLCPPTGCSSARCRSPAAEGALGAIKQQAGVLPNEWPGWRPWGTTAPKP